MARLWKEPAVSKVYFMGMTSQKSIPDTQAMNRWNGGGEGSAVQCPCWNVRVAAVAVSGIERGCKEIVKLFVAALPKSTVFCVSMVEMSVVVICLYEADEEKQRLPLVMMGRQSMPPGWRQCDRILQISSYVPEHEDNGPGKYSERKG